MEASHVLQCNSKTSLRQVDIHQLTYTHWDGQDFEMLQHKHLGKKHQNRIYITVSPETQNIPKMQDMLEFTLKSQPHIIVCKDTKQQIRPNLLIDPPLPLRLLLFS